MLTRLACVALVASVAACSDPCAGVIGCGETPRVAVEGRLLTPGGADAVPGASVALRVTYVGHVDSTVVTTDSHGFFSSSVPSTSADAPSISLRVTPPGRPGYILSPGDCHRVVAWGDACIIPAIVSEPNFNLIQFRLRSDDSPVAGVLVTFKRTGGATMAAGSPAKPVDSLSAVTDDHGIPYLFPPGAWAGSLDAVVGDLTVELPPPIGRVTRHGFWIIPNVYYSNRELRIQRTGPTLAYRFEFTDSVTGKPAQDVELQYRRLSGVATSADTFNIRSTSRGEAYFPLAPLAQGTVVGDLSIKAPSRPQVTVLKNVTLQTFDQDSTLLFARWRIGATGILYQIAGGR